MPVGTQYGDTSKKEDVLQFITQLTPTKTPVFNAIGSSTAASPIHQWQTRDLSVRADNAAIEGDSFTFVENSVPTRITNLTQIFRKTVRVSGTSQASDRHGIQDLVADQLVLRMTEWKTDVEHTLIMGSTASGNASDTARRMNGLFSAASTNATTYLSSLSLNEERLNDLVQNMWEDGAEATDCFVNGFLKRRISGFSQNDTHFQKQESKRVTNVVSVYESDFTVLNIQLSHDIPNATGAHGLLLVNRDSLAKSWLRAPFTERVAKTADSTDAVILGECTLEFGDEAAIGVLEGVG